MAKIKCVLWGGVVPLLLSRYFTVVHVFFSPFDVVVACPGFNNLWNQGEV